MKKKHIIGLATLGVLAITTYIILLYENKAYDPYEVAQINSFLSQQSNIESKTNGEMLGYSPKWPLFWGKFGSIKRDGVYKFNNIVLFNPKGYPRETSGCFSVNNFKFLWPMNISYGFIDSLVIKNCPNLKRVLAYRNQLTFVDIENCPSLEDLYLDENPLETLDLTGCPNLKEFRVRYSVDDILLRELIVLESQPWQEWDLDSLTTVIVKKTATKSFQDKQTRTDTSTESKANESNISTLDSEITSFPSTENSDEPKLFVDITDWKGVKCKKYLEDDGYTTIQECVFPNANMAQVYDIIKQFNENLKDTLPPKDMEYISEADAYIKVCYKYKTANELLIEIDYSGGVTRFEITQKNKNTLMKVTYETD